VRVEFYGPSLDFIRVLAERLGVAESVRVHRPVSYSESLSIQRNADLLLLLLWNDPAQTGVLTGKLFEYLGARRPILAVGPHPDEGARLILARGAGEFGASPDELSDRLIGWVRRKDAGELDDTPEAAGRGLTREAQAERLASCLSRVVTAYERAG
jgi:hypothetical protein